MNLDQYLAFKRAARRLTRSGADAADLLHDSLLVAVRQGRLEFDRPRDRAWLNGVMRKLAAQEARSGARRRRRDTRWASGNEQSDHAEAAGPSERVLAALSPATRQVAVLALHGLDPGEICYILELEPAAFRQRLTSLRRRLGRVPGPLRAEAMALAYNRPRREAGHQLDFGLIRRALMHYVGLDPGVGTHDPDGHLVAMRTK
ncbi:MAG: hypothetical protein R3348_05785 [Xanthomonadales bacterium]|nr:hypothetical protein [Xanthomonadales bacterium]